MKTALNLLDAYSSFQGIAWEWTEEFSPHYQETVQTFSSALSRGIRKNLHPSLPQVRELLDKVHAELRAEPIRFSKDFFERRQKISDMMDQLKNEHKEVFTQWCQLKEKIHARRKIGTNRSD